MNTAELFSGERLPRGGLSNEQELARSCPRPFFNLENPWHAYVGDASLWGWNESSWKWQSPDAEVQVRQKNCLEALLDGDRRNLTITIRNAIAGWMLSEMLTDVPTAGR